MCAMKFWDLKRHSKFQSVSIILKSYIYIIVYCYVYIYIYIACVILVQRFWSSELNFCL